jgi:hypothetical protein
MHEGGSGVTKRMEIESGPIDTIFLAVARKPLREAMAQAPVGPPRSQPRKYAHLIVLALLLANKEVAIAVAESVEEVVFSVAILVGLKSLRICSFLARRNSLKTSAR